jgi:hypothetical protein
LLIIHFISGREWPVIAALVIGLCAVIVPIVAKKIDSVWHIVTRFIGMILQRIVLTLIFYLCLTPIALISKWIGRRDPLKLSHRGSTTFSDVNKTFRKKDFEKPW